MIILEKFDDVLMKNEFCYLFKKEPTAEQIFDLNLEDMFMFENKTKKIDSIKTLIENRQHNIWTLKKVRFKNNSLKIRI